MNKFQNSNWRTLFVAMVFVSQTCGPVLAQLPPNVEVIAADADQAPGSIRINNLGDSSEPQQTPDLRALLDEVDLDLSKSPLSTQEQDMAIAISERVKATEWLGALGPVAVSPFFGLTCLSAIAIVGEDRLPEDHYLRRASTPLRHPLVFIVFLLLTILTSIPKFSKVSKPFAQAMDQLETYSAIVILLVIRVMGGIEMGPEESQVAVVYQAGFIEVTAEGMLMLATIVNIIVINTVKFFFEILIWITPIPFVDALFEVANKVACASLAAIYAFSPAIATIINLAILACCLLAFAWIKRREVFYRSILIEFVMHWWRPNANLPPDGKLIVFPKDKVGDIPAMSRCEFSKTQDGWAVRMPRMLRPAIDYAWTTGKPAIQSGLLKNQLTMDQFEFQFGKRHNQQLQALADTLGASCNETATQQTPFGNLSAEMA